MYEQFYGLREKPFSLTPDPEFLFVNRHFRGALEKVLYGIKRHEGFTAIVGDVGTGKTTLCWALLGRLEKRIRTALILNPMMTEEDMLRAILQDFGIRPKRLASAAGAADAEQPYDPSWMQGMTRKELIDELNVFLLESVEEDLFNILIIDEAQNLSLGVLEQLRLLSNLETAKKKLLQIIFVGQLEFEEKLQQPNLRQLAQRITIRYALKPLSQVETIQYIEHRLSIAGSKRSVAFTKGSLKNIFSYSHGYPRLINIICDRALLAGYSERSHVINSRMVRKAARGIEGAGRTARTLRLVTRKAAIPAAALLLLALLAALYFWGIRGRSWFSGIGQQTETMPANPVPVETTVPEPPRAVAPAPEHAVERHDAARSENAPVAATKQNSSHAVPAASPSDPVVAEAAPSGTYRLQVHSLATKGQADAAIADLKHKGYAAFSRLAENADGSQWFVVYTGPYDSLDSAHKDAEQLSREEKLKPIVRR